jgi:hypothetical protein
MRSEVLASSLSDCISQFTCSIFPPPFLELDIHFSGLAAVMCWEAYRTCVISVLLLLLFAIVYLLTIATDESVWMKETSLFSCSHLQFPFPLLLCH